MYCAVFVVYCCQHGPNMSNKQSELHILTKQGKPIFDPA